MKCGACVAGKAALVNLGRFALEDLSIENGPVCCGWACEATRAYQKKSFSILYNWSICGVRYRLAPNYIKKRRCEILCVVFRFVSLLLLVRIRRLL